MSCGLYVWERFTLELFHLHLNGSDLVRFDTPSETARAAGALWGITGGCRRGGENQVGASECLWGQARTTWGGLPTVALGQICCWGCKQPAASLLSSPPPLFWSDDTLAVLHPSPDLRSIQPRPSASGGPATQQANPTPPHIVSPPDGSRFTTFDPHNPRRPPRPKPTPWGALLDDRPPWPNQGGGTERATNSWRRRG